MAYDDLKEFDGRGYTGMTVGGTHQWTYPRGIWKERKVAPDQWEFTFTSTKERERKAPVGSGAPSNTRYHWYILAHQRVRKVDSNSYSTFMTGVKYKLAHRRPTWHRWSNQYPGRPSERETIMAILEEMLDRLRKESRARGNVSLEGF